MQTALWIAQGTLAAAVLGAGLVKVARSHADLAADPHMAWAGDFTPAAVKSIGVAEIAGAIGLVLPGLVGIGGWLTPLAAGCVLVLMLGAAATHVRRAESRLVAAPLLLGALAGLVGIGRWLFPPLG